MLLRGQEVDMLSSKFRENMAVLTAFKNSYERFISANKELQGSVLVRFCRRYSDFLRESYERLERDNAADITGLREDEAVLMGGDALHLSVSRREEHVSSWLRWILEAPVLPQSQRNLILENVFSAILDSTEYKSFRPAGARRAINFEGPVEFTTELVLKSGRKLDIVLKSKNQVIVIENKVEDRSFSKNFDYLDEISERWGGDNQVIPLMLLPLSGYEDYRGTEEGKAFEAFPPVTWESMLLALRTQASRVDKKTKRGLYWSVLVNSFVSFAEAEILGYDLDAVRSALEKDRALTPDSMAPILDYLKYWRVYGGNREKQS